MSRRRASPTAMAVLDEMLAQNTRDRDARSAAAQVSGRPYLECPACGTCVELTGTAVIRPRVKSFCWTCRRNTMHATRQP